MEAFRKKLSRSGIFAAFFLAAFAILASFHYHEAAAGEVSSHHCAVCHQSSGAKALTHEPTALPAPTISYEKLERTDVLQVLTLPGSTNDPIRGPPFA
ncbi:MAG TPA: hypothetical protein VFW62_07575 [bacterium]|nr:hypothetical protein [bacterium]